MREQKRKWSQKPGWGVIEDGTVEEPRDCHIGLLHNIASSPQAEAARCLRRNGVTSLGGARARRKGSEEGPFGFDTEGWATPAY